MILRIEDWYKYPGAIVHTATTNKSWVRMSGLLYKMGIENHTFMLALHNPVLENVDPFDKNLPIAIKLLIAKEVKDNPWYFFRECVRVPPPAGSASIPLKANRAVLATIWLAMNHITTLLLQIRQTGKSLIGNTLDIYHLNTASENTAITLLTKDDKLRAKTARDMKSLILLLPDYLQMMTNKDITNTEKITVKSLGNVLNILVGQRDKKAADGIGRGDTIPIVRIDEFAYIYNIETTLPVLLTATTAARELSLANNENHYSLFTTTPGKLNTEDGRFAYNVYSKALRWSEKFYDVPLKELELIMEKNSKQYRVMLLEFNHRQLGYSDDWLRARLAATLSSGDAAESDFFLKWINGGNNSPISKATLKIIHESKRDITNNFISRFGYVIRWYVSNAELSKLKTNGFLILGLDTSDALGGKNDDIGLVIRDSRTGAVVGVGLYNETNLSTFADFLVEVLEEFPKSVMVHERRSSATAIVDNMFRIMLIKRMNPFKRIYNLLVQNASGLTDNVFRETVDTMPTLETLNKYKRLFGFPTSGGSGENSRGLLYGNVFRSSLMYTADAVRDASLIKQLSGLRTRNNRIDHESGGHDDLVISWLLGYFFLQYGKNTEKYGLDYTDKLSSVVDNELKDKNSDVSTEDVQKQVELKEELEYYVKLLHITTNEMYGAAILTKIRYLETKIDRKIITNLNIESLLKDTKIYRRIANNKKYKKNNALLNMA